MRLTTATNSPSENSRIFVPLSLVVNPDLPDALLGKKKSDNKQPQTEVPRGELPSSDGLNTGMSLPTDMEVVNMAEMPKEEFLSIIRRSGLAGSPGKK